MNFDSIRTHLLHPFTIEKGKELSGTQKAGSIATLVAGLLLTGPLGFVAFYTLTAWFKSRTVKQIHTVEKNTPADRMVSAAQSLLSASTPPSQSEIQDLVTRANKALNESEQILKKQYENLDTALVEIAVMRGTVEELKNRLITLNSKEIQLITSLENTFGSLSQMKRGYEDKKYQQEGRFVGLDAPPDQKAIILSQSVLVEKIKPFRSYMKLNSTNFIKLLKCVVEKFVAGQNTFDIEKFMATLETSAEGARFPMEAANGFVDALITHLQNLKANNCQIQEGLIGTTHQADNPGMKPSSTLSDDEKKDIDLLRIRPQFINMHEDDQDTYTRKYLILFPAVRVYTHSASPPLVFAPIAIALEK